MVPTASSPRTGRADPAASPARSSPTARLRRRGLLFGGLTVALTAVAAVGVAASRGPSRPATGATAASWDLPALTGSGHVALADFRGEPTVVTVFAASCQPCDAELGDFAAVSAGLRGRVQFVGVDAASAGDRVALPRRHGVTWWPLAEDSGGRGSLRTGLGLSSVPVTVFYSPAGTVLGVEKTPLGQAALRSTIQRLYGVTP